MIIRCQFIFPRRKYDLYYDSDFMLETAARNLLILSWQAIVNKKVHGQTFDRCPTSIMRV